MYINIKVFIISVLSIFIFVLLILGFYVVIYFVHHIIKNHIDKKDNRKNVLNLILALTIDSTIDFFCLNFIKDLSIYTVAYYTSVNIINIVFAIFSFIFIIILYFVIKFLISKRNYFIHCFNIFLDIIIHLNEYIMFFIN